jgi:outer membrane lipoprotein LolB
MTHGQAGLVVACMLLAGCAGQVVRESPSFPATVAQIQAQAARVAVLEAHPRWSLQGRVAVSNGREGGNGRIDWQQDGPRFTVSLSAPITRQSWRLSGDGSSARLEGLDGGPRQDTDAERLLHEATGWVIPVAALSAWVRGTAAVGLPKAGLQFGSDGRLARIEQAGWTIDYAGWQPQPGLGTELPRHLSASRGDAKVRLVVDGWQQDTPSP